MYTYILYLFKPNTTNAVRFEEVNFEDEKL